MCRHRKRAPARKGIWHSCSSDTTGHCKKYQGLVKQRVHVGKFYFRPWGGESWCDVVLRLRSILDTVCREYCDERVLIVAHKVIVNWFRYLLEQLDEEAILAVDQTGDIPNCSITKCCFDPDAGARGKLVLVLVLANLSARSNRAIAGSREMPGAVLLAAVAAHWPRHAINELW